MNHPQKEIQFFVSYSKRRSILWVIKSCSILWVILKKRKGSILWVIFRKKHQFFEANKKKVQFFASHEKKVQFFESFLSKEKSILWVVFEKKKKFHRVIFKKVQFWESYKKRANSVSHIRKKSSILWVTKKKPIQFFEPNLEKAQLKSFFSKCLKEYNLSFIWTFFDMTQRTYLLFFLKITQRIDFFQKYDSKNWTSFWVWLKRIELTFFEYDSMNRSHFFECDSIEIWVEKKTKNWFFSSKLNFSSHDSKNWTFFFLNLDSKNWTFYYLTRRIELFSYLTQCIELFSCFPQRIHWVTLENKKGSILWVISEKIVESSESYWRISILRVVFKKKKFNFEKKKVIFKKKINSVIRLEKKKQLCDSYSYFKKNSILRVIVKKRGSILRVIFWKNILKRRFKSVSHRKSNSLSFFFGEKNQVFESCYKEGFNSSSHIGKNLWVILKKKKFSSLYRIFGESSILWVVFFEKNSKIQFFDSCSKKFNSSSHVKEGSIHWVVFKQKWVRFFESYSKKRKVLFFKLKKKKQFFELHSKKVQFFESKIKLRRGS